ncbi:MAG: hypothetical protein ABR583_05815 [Gaiellaceae bacterium]
MRGLLAASVAVLAVLAAATASSGSPGVGPGAGTLTLRDGRGNFVLQMKGAVIGRVDRGRITIEDPDATDGAAPIVKGAELRKPVSEGVTTYGGKGIRFRLFGGRFTVRITNGTGVQLSVVGRGKAMLEGAGFQEFGLRNGSYAVNSDQFLPVPDERVWVQLRAPSRF